MYRRTLFPLLLVTSLLYAADSDDEENVFISNTITQLGGYWSDLLQLIPTLEQLFSSIGFFEDTSDAAVVIKNLITTLDENPSAEAVLPFGTYVLVCFILNASVEDSFFFKLSFSPLFLSRVIFFVI